MSVALALDAADVRDPDEGRGLTDRQLAELARTAPIADEERCPHSTRPGQVRAGCSRCILGDGAVERVRPAVLAGIEHGRRGYRYGCKCATCVAAWIDPALAREENSERSRRGHEIRRARLRPAIEAGIVEIWRGRRGPGRPPTRAAEPIALAPGLAHGAAGYKHGCECAPCRAANATRKRGAR